MKKIICIDLTRYDARMLKVISEYLDIEKTSILFDYKKEGIKKIWIEEGVGFVKVEHGSKSIYNKSVDLFKGYSFSKNQSKKLRKIKPTDFGFLFEKPVSFTEKDVDVILEKISESGMSSLSKREVKILNLSSEKY